jgi:hypothetical protein
MGLKVYLLKKKQAQLSIAASMGLPEREGRKFRRAKKYLGPEFHGWFF